MKGKRILALVTLIVSGMSSPVWPAGLDTIQALADRGRAEKALRQLELFLVGSPNELEGRFLRGVLLAELGRNSEAERAFRDLRRDFPDRPEPTHNLAVLLALGGRPATAIVTLENVVDRYPGYEEAAGNLERIRSGARADEFDPLAGDASRVPLVLTGRLGSFPLPAQVAEPAPTPVETFTPSGAQSSPTPEMPGVDAVPAAVTVETARVPKLEPETTAPEPEAPPVGPIAVPAATPELQELDAAAIEPVPVIGAAPPPAPGADLKAELEPVVVAWAAAWSQQRVREYLGFYAADFQPTGFPSREAWQSARRQRVATPSLIEVEIDLASLTVREEGPAAATVTFVQGYSSDRYSDTVQKTLGFVRREGVWKIRIETSQ